MTAGFMFLISALYIAASCAALWERQFLFAGLTACWGIGNAILAYMAVE